MAWAWSSLVPEMSGPALARAVPRAGAAAGCALGLGAGTMAAGTRLHAALLPCRHAHADQAAHVQAVRLAHLAA